MHKEGFATSNNSFFEEDGFLTCFAEEKWEKRSKEFLLGDKLSKFIFEAVKKRKKDTYCEDIEGEAYF